MSLDKQAFYISNDKKIYLAVIEGESVELTRNADEIASIKLNELVTALSKPIDHLKETQLFRFYPDLPLERVVISAEGSLPFELDLKNNQTLPPPFQNVSVHRNLMGKFYSMLTAINIKNEIPYVEKQKFKKLGEIKFINKNSSLLWELWLKDKNSADALVIDTKNKRSFLMVGGTLKLFFVHIQDYWDKKVIQSKDFKSFDELPVDFYQGDKKARVIVMNREPMEFRPEKYKVDQLKMEQLIQFIFNLGPKDQAERISPLSESEKKQLLSGDYLRIEIMGQELILWRKIEELIVVNLTQGLKVHFSLLDEKFRGTFEDMLK
jgi:hypothetical protein